MSNDDSRRNYTVNPVQRTPWVLVLDASSSMSGPQIQQLNEGLKLLERELKSDPAISARLRIAIVCVGGPAGGASVIQDWDDAIDFTAPSLETGNLAPLGEGMLIALDLIANQTKDFQRNGISYTYPGILLISNGEPTDDWKDAARRCREAESNNEVLVFPIGVEAANQSVLGKFTNRVTKKLDGLKFIELLHWGTFTCRCCRLVLSQPTPGEIVELPPGDPWMVISGSSHCHEK